MRKRSIAIRGRKTAVSMESPFWTALKQIAAGKGITLSALVERIDAERIESGTLNLSGACRCFVLAELEAELAALKPCAAANAGNGAVQPCEEAA